MPKNHRTPATTFKNTSSFDLPGQARPGE